MAFDPKTWVDGELITAEDLNRLEQAVDATDAALDGKASTNHTHNIGRVTGLQTALDGKVDGTDPRLTDARTPTAHQHTLDDVDGLAARLQSLEQKTGLRRINLPSGGNLTVQRTRESVRINVNGVVVPAGQSGDVSLWTIPTGFRAMQTERGLLQEGAAGVLRLVNVLAGSNLYARNVSANAVLYGWITYETADPWPTNLPGTPA